LKHWNYQGRIIHLCSCRNSVNRCTTDLVFVIAIYVGSRSCCHKIKSALEILLPCICENDFSFFHSFVVLYVYHFMLLSFSSLMLIFQITNTRYMSYNFTFRLLYCPLLKKMYLSCLLWVVGYWSQTRDGRLPQRKPLPRSAANSAISNSTPFYVFTTYCFVS
jgi:hypothetical protein